MVIPRLNTAQTPQQQYMVQQMLRIIDSYVGNKQINVNNVMSGIKVIIAPMMTHILSKYSEPDFHRVMTTTYKDEQGKTCSGFDFLGDWRRNHLLAYNAGLMVARSFKQQLNFNVDITTRMIVDIMRAWGWHVSPLEMLSLRHVLVRIKRQIGFSI